MNALRYLPSEKGFSLEQVEVPRITQPNQVLIEVKFAGLCGTDLHVAKGEFSQASTVPVTLGHEFSGVVVNGGKDALEKFPIGSRVGVDPNRGCYNCQFCSEGNIHFCQKAGVHDGIGIYRNGGFAKLSLIPMEQVFSLPDAVSLEQGCLCEPLSCLLHGWNRLQKVGPVEQNSNILVIGAGIIGNLWTVMFQHTGFKNVSVVEPNDHRRRIASNLGTGCKVYHPKEFEMVMESKSKLEIEMSGFDIIIDCTGFPPVLEQAIKWTRRGGKICVFGCAPVGKETKLCPEEIFNKELTIFGTLVNPHTYSRAVWLAANMGEEKLSFEKLGIKKYSLEDYKSALSDLEKGIISKAVFQF